MYACPERALQATDECVRRCGVMGKMRARAARREEGKAGEMTSALFDQQTHQVFGCDDPSFEVAAHVGEEQEIVGVVRVFDPLDQIAEEKAHGLDNPPDRVQREEQAQEEEEQLRHALHYMSGQVPGRIGDTVSYNFCG